MVIVREDRRKARSPERTPVAVRVMLWAQIAEEIRAAIRSGELHPGQALVSVARDAEVRGVSQGTVQQARRTLVGEGWLRTVPGSGVFVSDRQPVDVSDLSALVRDVVAGLDDVRARVDRIENVVIGRSDDRTPTAGR